MNWFDEHSISYSILILSLVISFGLALGQIPLFRLKLGIAGVLFSGIVFSHFGYTLDGHLMHFIREFGLILFVYAIGLQVGPGFVNSFLHNGISLNLMAAGIVLLGAVVTLLISQFGGIEIPVAVGLFSGATTNTPSLATAQEILGQLPGVDADTLKQPGLGYAVAYPFGVIGIILSMLVIKHFFAINVEGEAKNFDKQQRQSANRSISKDLIIENPNLNGLTIAQIPFFDAMSAIVTRIAHQDKVSIVSSETMLQTGDSIRLVGKPKNIDKLKILIGPDSPVNLNEISNSLHLQRFVVTNKEAIGKTIDELRTYYAVTISRIQRPEVEIIPNKSTRIHFGDELHVIGSKEALNNIEKVLGNSLEKINHPQVMPIFIGITLGVILGSWPLYIPGIPSAVKLGLAGGPLIMAIVLSRVDSWGTMTWQMPKSSNIILKDIGIVLFLACVGLNAGDQFLATLVEGDGLKWLGFAVLITLLPLLIVAMIARLYLRLNFLSICGLLAGSMTDPPALAFANGFSPSSAVAIAYATVYPLVMILRIISAQLIILLFM
ncbi:putative transporter [Methylomarinum sp. Ch1-1]|uniref:Transporter n=1 Tax=Methylomarinum roseum TaxID=3067653 RepID=A0AAU7NTB2_9GAMM|nr:putative transporter [Methylomarinum sp. Ch1-1]MDP4519765.1 putative transporter [Methylomarinum sp. Ch1-1]